MKLEYEWQGKHDSPDLRRPRYGIGPWSLKLGELEVFTDLESLRALKQELEDWLPKEE